MATIVDSYSESNQDAGYSTYFKDGLAQSFAGDGGILNCVKWYLYKQNSPTGNAVANIYAMSGTYGSNDNIPTGSTLATSDNFDVSTLTGSYQLITFNFNGVNKITLTNGTKYVLTIEYPNNAINYIVAGFDNSTPVHGGNLSTLQSGTWTAGSKDFVFYVYKDDVGGTAVKDIIQSGIIAAPR